MGGGKFLNQREGGQSVERHGMFMQENINFAKYVAQIFDILQGFMLVSGKCIHYASRLTKSQVT